jgi:hypothetical protein
MRPYAILRHGPDREENTGDMSDAGARKADFDAAPYTSSHVYGCRWGTNDPSGSRLRWHPLSPLHLCETYPYSPSPPTTGPASVCICFRWTSLKVPLLDIADVKQLSESDAHPQAPAPHPYPRC